MPLPRCRSRRLTQWWSPLPGLPLALPVTVGLVREGGKWLLVDAGLRDGWRRPHASHLLAALRATIPAGDALAGIAREWRGRPVARRAWRQRSLQPRLTGHSHTPPLPNHVRLPRSDAHPC